MFKIRKYFHYKSEMNHIFTWKFGPAVSISENSGNDKLINPPCREHDFKLLFIMTEREPSVPLYYLYTHTLKTFLVFVYFLTEAAVT